MPVLVYVSMVVDEVWNKRAALFLNQTWEIKVKVTKNNEALILSPCVQDNAGLFFIIYSFSLSDSRLCSSQTIFHPPPWLISV